MNKHLICVLLLWPLSALADADAPFLWEIKGPQATHYLLGSVHMLPAESQPLPVALQLAYDKTEGVIFETDLAALSDPKAQMQVLSAASTPDGIKPLIGNTLYQKLVQRTAALEIPLDSTCAQYKPWFCAMTLEVLSFARAGFKPEYGLDQVFYSRAQRDGKSVRWLEEPEAHLQLFTQMSDRLGTEFLGSMLDELADAQRGPQEMFRMWRDSDVVTLEKITLELKAKQPRAYARLLSGRSRAWMPQLTRDLSAASPQLIVVGAAHLVGPDGLLKLLQLAGYEAHPVETAPAPDADPLPASAALH